MSQFRWMRSQEEKEKLKELGEKIRSLRLERGHNQTEFANLIGKDQPSVNRLENGNVNPGYLYLVEIAKGLEIDVSELIPNSTDV